MTNLNGHHRPRKTQTRVVASAGSVLTVRPKISVSLRTKKVRHDSRGTLGNLADRGRGVQETPVSLKNGDTPPNSIGGHWRIAPHGATAPSDDRHGSVEVQGHHAVIATIKVLWRRRQTWHRAEKSLTLQCLAICRGASGISGVDEKGRKKQQSEAQAMLGRIEKGSATPSELAAEISCVPLLAARNLIRKQREDLDKKLKGHAQKLPIAAWVRTVRGFGPLNLAALIGETANYDPDTGKLRCIGEYKTVSALWKRMGLAVIEGERQRRKAGVDGIAHAYAPHRRSVAWTTADCMIKANKKDGDPYRAIYEKEKARQLAAGLSKSHSHNRAARYMTKKVYADLWSAWRKPLSPE